MSYYDKIWLKANLCDPKRWPTWNFLKEYVLAGGRFLEIGPGNNPRIPIKSSYFVEKSLVAAKKLGSAGGRAVFGQAENLPYHSCFFDLVCAFEVIEHIEDDKKALSEIYRVLKKNGIFVFSTPLFQRHWSSWDEIAGHKRRYEPDELEEKLKKTGFFVEKFYDSGSSLFFFLRKMILNSIFQKPAVFISRNLPSFLLAKINNFYLLFPFKVRQIKLAEGEFREIKKHNQVIVFCRKKGGG